SRRSEREYLSERSENETRRKNKNEELERKIALLQKQLRYNNKKKNDDIKTPKDMSQHIRDKANELYSEHVKELVEKAENDPYPDMPRYDLMTELEQVESHAQFALVFKDIYRLIPDMEIVDPEASLETKYIIYQACYRHISVKNLSEIYRI